MAGSPVINFVPLASCTYDHDGDPGSPEVALATDQRGVARPQETGCEIGAVEYVEQCQDGIDNDGDGRTDFGDDPGCDDALDSSELSAALVCDNGISTTTTASST